MSMGGQIFISYRREESRWSARSLYDRLAASFDRKQIFMDIDAIALGDDFVKAIEKTVGECDVLIAVIGAHWLTSKDDQGGRRLDNPGDFVRREIGTALKRDIRVIPVLVDGALMPRSSELPDDLKALVRRNALQVSDTGFDDDCRRLVAAIEQVLEKTTAERREREEKEQLETEPQPPPPGPVAPSTSPGGRKLARLAGVVILLAFVVGVAVYFGSLSSSLKPRISEPVAQSSVSPSAAVAVVTASPSISATLSSDEQARRALQDATKEHPWVNSLGMKFVPVAGTQVLFSVWDTRVEDFRAFVDGTAYDATRGMFSLGKNGWEQRGATWEEPGFEQGVSDPVVGVNWRDATAFCEWLTKRERGSGGLPKDMHYRLPTDEEWSVAVGLNSERGNTPEEKDYKIKLYPWGTQWPPPKGAGNYAGEESRMRSVIEGYNDGYPCTSPVASFAANKYGLYDMGGNVWQWCEDWYNSERESRVLRGASWASAEPDKLLASYRSHVESTLRLNTFGFRCVVARESSR